MIKKLSESIREYKRESMLSPLFVTLEVVMEIIIPLLMARLIDEGLNRGDMRATWFYGLIMLAAACLSLSFGALAGKFCATASTGLAKNLRHDIQTFKKENGCSRVIVFWIASTEKYTPRNEKVHGSLSDFEAAMKADDREHISPSMIYAYAALMEGCPFIMGAPNVCVDIPAMFELSRKQGLPIVGKDFKSGQTMMKSAMAPIFRTRLLGVEGWFSTNILGNRDGQVIEHPDNFETKRISKASSIEWILEQDEYPELYTDIYHKVKINYYPPRKDNKESWDNIDIFGWMNYPMQIKVNFLCRDSILAAPICLDLLIFTDLALRAGLTGVQEWLSFYVKKPMTYDDERPVHDLFQQFAMLKNQIRLLGGYEADQELD